MYINIKLCKTNLVVYYSAQLPPVKVGFLKIAFLVSQLKEIYKKKLPC